MSERSKHLLVLAALAALSAAALLAAPFFGMETIPLGTVLDPASLDADIFWKLRLPRVILAFLAGAGLSLSGMTFQAMFRNPLATPFTLGVASGASFGAAVYLKFNLAFVVLGISGVSAAAFLGALLAILLVYGLTRIKRGMSSSTMLLAGVAISFFFSSLILFIQYLSDFTHSFRILRWLMGRVEANGFQHVLDVLPFAVCGIGIILMLPHELNLLAAGDDIAISRGVNVNGLKKILFFATSIMVGGVVAICGPIGFVGMVSPHICRLIIGNDHRVLAPASILFGGLFLVLSDTIARSIIAPAEMPVGIVTALIGGPFFVWLLVREPGGKTGGGPLA